MNSSHRGVCALTAQCGQWASGCENPYIIGFEIERRDETVWSRVEQKRIRDRDVETRLCLVTVMWSWSRVERPGSLTFVSGERGPRGTYFHPTRPRHGHGNGVFTSQSSTGPSRPAQYSTNNINLLRTVTECDSTLATLPDAPRPCGASLLAIARPFPARPRHTHMPQTPDARTRVGRSPTHRVPAPIAITARRVGAP